MFITSLRIRRRRQYLQLDITQLLAEEGIDSNLLMPRHQGTEERVSAPDSPLPPVANYLPLEVRPISQAMSAQFSLVSKVIVQMF